MKRFRELVKCMRQTRFRVQRRVVFPIKKSDIMLFRCVTDRFEWLEPSEKLVTPDPGQLARDPGVRRLTDRDRSIERLIGRDDHGGEGVRSCRSTGVAEWADCSASYIT